ncbi:putative Histidine kinase [Syntrophobacter sp. SbD1]|nr:putative Histidine kinase [Syntrophobacter sp. SbD1]
MVTDQLPSVKILVVDDDPGICDMLKEVLEHKGYDPVICSTPVKALSLSENESFGLAFVDINLPGMSGLELATKLRERGSCLEVVFITGSDMIEHAVQAVKLGASDFLRKPFSFAELGICLHHYEERSSLKRQIQLAEKRYFDLVQGLPLLIFVLRKDLRLDFINQASLSILGYTPEEVIEVPDWFSEHIHHEDRSRVLEFFQSMFDSEVPGFSTDCRLVHRKGRLIYAIIKSISTRRCLDDSGMECVDGAIVDITDRVFLEKSLVQREKLKTLGAISAEVAHEIRNPLVSIGGFARRLQKKGMNQPELDIILSESGRLERILGRIRDYLKPVEVQLEECSINSIVEKSLDLLSPEIERMHIRCRLDLAPAMALAYVDRDVLGQVCINLIRNAVAAIGKGGTLNIRTLEGEQSFHLEFRNRSTSPPLKNPERLFLPFDEGGQSIGLPLCQRLLKTMEGTISYAEEQGEIAFTVSLPKVTQPPGRIPFQAECA